MSTKLKTPFETLLPPLSTNERAALKARIKDEGGVHDSVLLTEDNEILDGHNRHKIDKGCPTKVVPGSGSWTDATKKAFVIRCNLGRRNLSPDQRAEAMKTCKAIALELKKEGRTQKAVAGLLGVSTETVSRWLERPSTHKSQSGNRRKAPDSRVKLNTEAKKEVAERIKEGESQEQVAADFGISQQHAGRVAAAEKKKADVKAELATAIDTTDKDGHRWKIVDDESPVKCAALITDPPYGILDEKWEPDDLEPFTRDWATRWAGCGADFLAVFFSQRFLFDGRVWLEESFTEHEFHQLLVWHYPNNKSPQSRKGFKQTWEPIFFFRRKDCDREILLHDGQWGDGLTDFDCHVAAVPQSNFNGQDMKQHPAQKPVSVMRWLVNSLTGPGEHIVDPFCGSGTTGIAALQLGRTFHGIEKDAEFQKLARRRLAAHGKNEQ